jgi:hypothetical protein
MIVEALQELQLSTLEVRVPECHQVLDFDFEKLVRQLAVYLGPYLSREDLRALTFSFANIMIQLVGWEPISPDVLAWDASAAYPFGLHNAAETIASFMAQRLCPLLKDTSLLGWRTTS